MKNALLHAVALGLIVAASMAAQATEAPPLLPPDARYKVDILVVVAHRMMRQKSLRILRSKLMNITAGLRLCMERAAIVAATRRATNRLRHLVRSVKSKLVVQTLTYVSWTSGF